MNLDFSEDQKLAAEDGARLPHRTPPPAGRSRRARRRERHWNPELWKAAAEMGWQGADDSRGVRRRRLRLPGARADRRRRSAARSRRFPFGTSVYLATEAILLAGKRPQKQEVAAGARRRRRRSARWRWPRAPASPVAGAASRRASRAASSTARRSASRRRTSRRRGRRGAHGRGHLVLAIVDLKGPGVTRTATESIDPTRASAVKLTFKDAPAELLGDEGRGWELSSACSTAPRC